MDRKTKDQMTGVIIIDIISKLNMRELDRSGYQELFNKEMMERVGYSIDLSLLDIE